MLTQNIRIAAMALAAGGMTIAAPASAVPAAHAAPVAGAPSALGDLTFNYSDRDDRRWGRYERQAQRRYERDQRRYQRDQRRHYRDQRRYYGEPVHHNTRVWRGDDNRYYCRKSDGTTGLLIGGAVGALLGREVVGRNGDRTLGAILGAAGGALLGKSIDSKTRCN